MVVPSSGSLPVEFASLVGLFILLVTSFDRAPITDAFSVPPSRPIPSQTGIDKLVGGRVLKRLALWSKTSETTRSSIDHATARVVDFWDAYNQRSVPDVLNRCDSRIVWDDYDSSRACRDSGELERRLRLEDLQRPQDKFRVEVNRVLVNKHDENQVGVSLTLHYDESDDQQIDPKVCRKRRGCAVMTFSAASGLVERVDFVAEQMEKGGESNLQLLKFLSPLLSVQIAPPKPMASPQTLSSESSQRSTSDETTAAERYFRAWNRRNMSEAIMLFADNVTYDDTAFPTPFEGKDKLQRHLELCASIFPPQLTFEVDNVVLDSRNALQITQWHAANNGKPLPYTRGCSMYEINDSNGLIVNGLDFVEPNGPIKPGDARLPLSVLQSLFSREPARWIPVVVWASYMYVVFFSDGILPGANALVLEERTWKEVLNLSLNFFLVAPILHLPFSPVVHPMLEAVFNLLLSWAALFAGFLSDDRRDKPNLIPFLPTVIGMQFLTSAFLLPYLATRSSEPPQRAVVPLAATSRAARWVGENRLWGPCLGGVGLGSVAWAFVGRTDEFGTDLIQRWDSFVSLLSIDRVGSSFLVDLAIFAVFQGWLVDDDLKRRGLTPGPASPWFATLAKFVPFFGLAAYLALRPALWTGDGGSDNE